jgi:PAS domain-containing protein
LVADLILVLSASPGKTCRQSKIMLARVRRSGTFELLTVAAWAGALGYRAGELSGKSLHQLLQLERGAASEFVAALLDEKETRPLEVKLRCKDERRKCFRLYRRFDPHEQAVFVVADEVPEERPEPLRACG